MTDPLTITIAAAIFGVPNAIAVTHSIVRWVRPYADTPSPCERDAQDGRGEAGEGAEFRTIHRSVSK